jgi:hypothetical protein
MIYNTDNGNGVLIDNPRNTVNKNILKVRARVRPNKAKVATGPGEGLKNRSQHAAPV